MTNKKVPKFPTENLVEISADKYESLCQFIFNSGNVGALALIVMNEKGDAELSTYGREPYSKVLPYVLRDIGEDLITKLEDEQKGVSVSIEEISEEIKIPSSKEKH